MEVALVPKMVNFPPGILTRALQRQQREKASLREVGAHTFGGLVRHLVDGYGKGTINP